MLIWWLPLALIIAVLFFIIITIKKKLNQPKPNVLPITATNPNEPSLIESFGHHLQSWFQLQPNTPPSSQTTTGGVHLQGNPQASPHRAPAPTVSAPPRSHGRSTRTHAPPQVPETAAIAATNHGSGSANSSAGDHVPQYFRRHWQFWSIVERQERQHELGRLPGSNASLLPPYEPPPPAYCTNPREPPVVYHASIVSPST
ncbi:hypothetical protein FRC03_007567 [Tulasnella sp. 419]|nr:hypothetical protein FRC03_007567 [Tulasnella sp. 419]